MCPCFEVPLENPFDPGTGLPTPWDLFTLGSPKGGGETVFCFRLHKTIARTMHRSYLNSASTMPPSSRCWSIVILVLFFFLVVPVCQASYASDSTKTTSNPTTELKKEEGDAAKKAGLVKKLFAKFSKWLSGAEKEAKAAEKAEKGVSSGIDKSSYVHRNVHLRQRKWFEAGLLKGFSKSDSLPPADTIPYKQGQSFQLQGEVFGWHPYWSGDAWKAYHFGLLSTVAYFSYEIDPKTGSYKTIHDWLTTPMIDTAKAYKCKVLLTITNFGGSENNQFLGNAKAQQTLIDSVLSLIKKRGADGVNVDFEGVPNGQKKNFNDFLVKLGFALHQANPAYQMTMALYALDASELYDFATLNEHVDRYVIMGYDFYGKSSETAGPISPLQSGKIWWQYNLETSIHEYLAQGAPAAKLIMALPYYGDIWETEGLNIPSNAKGYLGSRPYSYIAKTFKSKGVIDTASKSTYYAYISGEGDFRQCWFEGPQSLSDKYAYVKKQKLAGIGIWALGYDNGTEVLWEVIEKQFAKPAGSGGQSGTTAAAASAGSNTSDTTAAGATGGASDSGGASSGSGDEKASQLEQALQIFFHYPVLVTFLLGYLIFMCALAFVLALLNCETRVYFFNWKAFRVYYITFFSLVFAVALRYLDILNNASLLLLVGVAFGSFITWAANRWVYRAKENTP